MTNAQLNVLFVCSGNICRSPMAEYILRHRLDPAFQSRIRCQSAGVYGFIDQPATTQVITTMAKDGIDISPHRSQAISEKLINQAHLILAMSDRHQRYLISRYPYIKGKTFLLGAFQQKEYFPEKHSIPDPYGGSLKNYTKIYKRLVKEIDRILPHLYRIAEEMDK